MIVSPRNFQIYLQKHGWQLRAEALDERGLYWYEHPTLRPRQITFLSDEEAPDYEESLELAIDKVAEVERLSKGSLLDSIQDASDDTLFFRLFGDRIQSERLPFSFVTDVLGGARELLLAAAHSVLMPRLYHPRLGRREALEFLDSTNFGQTAPGSFVFKLTCPVPETLDLFPGEAEEPFSRKVTSSVNQGLRALGNALRTDTLPSLIETERDRENPVLSANFCEALTRFQDEKLENSLDISFLWALTVNAPPSVAQVSPIRFKTEDFKRIDEVREVLRSTEQAREGLFIATVESLNGVMGADGRRSGEVIFMLSTPHEDRLVRARVNLPPDDYAKADKAHMQDAAYALFNGRLHLGRQPRLLTDLDEIEWYVGGQELK